MTNAASNKLNGIMILGKLHQLMSKVTYIQKDSENKEQKYKYLSYEAVSEKIQAALIELKLVSVPHFETVSEKEYSTAKGALWKYVRTKLTLEVFDTETGEYILAVSEGSGVDPGDKAVAKAQTMAMKSLWCKLLNVPIGEDPEADLATDQQVFSVAANGHWQTLEALWLQNGWDASQLNQYLEQRFHKPVNQIAASEYQVMINEAQQHLAFKRQEQGIPF